MSDTPRDPRTCPRCGGQAFHRPDAVVPGDLMAPRGSRRAEAHAQPAWACVACGHLEPEERRAARRTQRQDA